MEKRIVLCALYMPNIGFHLPKLFDRRAFQLTSFVIVVADPDPDPLMQSGGPARPCGSNAVMSHNVYLIKLSIL